MRHAWTTVRDHPSATLLFAQLAPIVGYPFLSPSTAGRSVIGVVARLR